MCLSRVEGLWKPSRIPRHADECLSSTAKESTLSFAIGGAATDEESNLTMENFLHSAKGRRQDEDHLAHYQCRDARLLFASIEEEEEEV